MAKFTRADLKPGYIVVLRSGVLGICKALGYDVEIVKEGSSDA